MSTDTIVALCSLGVGIVGVLVAILAYIQDRQKKSKVVSTTTSSPAKQSEYNQPTNQKYDYDPYHRWWRWASLLTYISVIGAIAAGIGLGSQANPDNIWVYSLCTPICATGLMVFGAWIEYGLNRRQFFPVVNSEFYAQPSQWYRLLFVVVVVLGILMGLLLGIVDFGYPPDTIISDPTPLQVTIGFLILICIGITGLLAPLLILLAIARILFHKSNIP